MGFSQDANGDEKTVVATLWENGTMTDLNTLVSAGSPSFLMKAASINVRGGWGRRSNGDIRPFLLGRCDDDHVSAEACDGVVR